MLMGRKGSSACPSARERGHAQLNLPSRWCSESVLLQVVWMHEDPPPQASVPFFLTSRLWVCLLHWQQLQEAILCHQVSMVQSHSDT